MIDLLKSVLLLTVVCAMAGCAGMSAEECVTADWRTIGYEDGAAGRQASAISRYRKDCAEHGVTANFDAYEIGRRQGLRDFCRPANGYRIGRKGTTYNGVCPADMEAAFLTAYEDGFEYFSLEKDVKEIERDIRRVERDLAEANEEIKLLEAELIADGVDSEQRASLLAETKEMARYIGELENRRDDLIYELGVREERLARHLDSHSSR